MVIVVTEKHQNNYFIQVKPLLLVVDSATPLLFEKMLILDVILTSVTIIKDVFLRKLF